MLLIVLWLSDLHRMQFHETRQHRMKLPVSHCHQQLHPAHLSLKRNAVGQSHDSELANKRMQERSGNHTRVAGPLSEEQETEATTHTGSLWLDNRRWKMSPGPMTHRFCPDIPTVGSEAKHENMGRSCLVSKAAAAAAAGACGAVEDVLMANFESLVTNLPLLEPHNPSECRPSFQWQRWTDLMPTSSRIRQLELVQPCHYGGEECRECFKSKRSYKPLLESPRQFVCPCISTILLRLGLKKKQKHWVWDCEFFLHHIYFRHSQHFNSHHVLPVRAAGHFR